jgi:hypothetical protein
MWVHLAMTGVYHQPFEIRLIYQNLKKRFPCAAVTPTDKATMGIAPPTVIRRKVSPWRTGAHNPEHRVDKAPIILRNATPTAFATG